MQGLRRWIERTERAPVLLRGTAVRSNGRRIAVEIHELGLFGCRLHTDEPLEPNESLRLVAPPLHGLVATVRWSAGEVAGVQFNGGDWT